MRKWLARLLAGAALISSLSLSAFAAEEQSTVEVTVNGEGVEETLALMYGWTSYLPMDKGVLLLRPEAEVTVEEGLYTAKAEDFTMTACAGDA